MPIFIVVTGVHNSGKTTTIRTLWNNLGGEPLGDGCEVVNMRLIYRGRRIGFYSLGDNERLLEDLAKGIPHYIEDNCDIIVCAARSYGGTHNYYTRYFIDSTFYLITKVKIDQEYLNDRLGIAMDLVAEYSEKLIQISNDQAAEHAKFLIDSFR